MSVIDPESRSVIQTLGERDGMGRDLRHIVVAPDGGSAYVSAYVGDRVTRLVRMQSGRFSVSGSVSLGRRPLVDALLKRRQLVTPFSGSTASSRAYFLLVDPAARERAAVRAFETWLLAQARQRA